MSCNYESDDQLAERLRLEGYFIVEHDDGTYSLANRRTHRVRRLLADTYSSALEEAVIDISPPNDPRRPGAL